MLQGEAAVHYQTLGARFLLPDRLQTPTDGLLHNPFAGAVRHLCPGPSAPAPQLLSPAPAPIPDDILRHSQQRMLFTSVQRRHGTVSGTCRAGWI